MCVALASLCLSRSSEHGTDLCGERLQARMAASMLANGF